MVQDKCLNEETLTSYLEGLLDAPVRAAAEQHLVGCDNCRSQLVYYMRILDEDVLEEEESVVDSAMEQWSRRPVPAARRRSVLGMRWMALAASVLLAIGVGALVQMNRSDVPAPVEIIDLLLSSERPFEARLSQQPYRTLFATRGAEGPEIAMDPLEAELLRQAASNHMMGTFYLLNKDFDKAIEYLEQAAEALSSDASLHNDLGVAYLEKGGATVEERAVTSSRARQEFEAALARDSAYAPAVYNLTLLYVRQGLRAEAEAQQQRYLELDPESEWADEVRRLASLN